MGHAVSEAAIEETKKRLVERFGGLSDFRHRNEGVWKIGKVIYRDAIVILRILADDGRDARPFFTDLKKGLKQRLEQEDILIVERLVNAL